MLISVMLISFVGFTISLYGLWVEYQVKKDANYKAVCDISDRASCSKTFLSPWGALLGVSNTYLGLIFYLAMFVLGGLHLNGLVLLGAVGACIFSLFLAYILYAKVKTICFICISIYVINALLLWAAYDSL